jgi:ATP-dependent Clp protease ATP-binding subunit ClpA
VFDTFTNPAKRSITLSQDEAITLGHDFIGTEHMLLGLARVRQGMAGQLLSEHGVTPDRARNEAVRLLEAAGIPATGGRAAAEALATIGIDVDEIRRRADDTFGPGQFFFPRPAYTPRAKKALELTLREAQALDHDFIGTEHILLGLLADDEDAGGNLAVRVLRAIDVDPSGLRAAVLAKVAATTS